MRQSLMQTFNQMYFLDLHGNSKKKEKAKDGSKDENVFDIEQGVCISILIKISKDNTMYTKSDMYGLRERKYNQLLAETMKTMKWKMINSTFNFQFINQDSIVSSEYYSYKLLSDFFFLNSVGIATAKDFLAIQDSKSDMIDVCSDLYNLSHDDLKQRYFVDDDLLDEKLSLSKQDIVKHNNDSNMIKQILYRPFSIKYTFYSGLSSGLVNRPRNNVMKHLLYSNIGLIVSKINRQLSLGYCFVTSMLTDLHILDVARDSTYLFPLYLYEEVDFLGETQLEKKPNIKAEIIAELTAKYKQQATGAVGTSVPASSNTGGTPVSTLSPEQIMSYIYAVLHSPTYRSKYADFLKTDFPRIPFTDDYKVFEGLSGLGWDLMQAHLQKKDELSKLYPGCGDFAVKGNNTVDKVLYTEAQSRLYINTDQYFANVPSEVYSFYIGGYQVLHKYLKDRKGRMLTLDEINNVESVVKILLFTIEQMQKIDTLTQDWI
jgi:predicted helicase